jgi:hypothetical protein
MKFRQSIFLLTALAMIAALVACSSSSTTTGTTPPVISVVFTGTVPTTLQTSATTPLTAMVNNDTGTGGVNWTVTCGLTGTNVCGSFSASNTASGSPVTYTAPSAATSVTVTATAADNSAATAMATITITAPAISIFFSGILPPSALQTSASAPLTATVNNDPNQGGVNWTVTCGLTGTNVCGSFSASTTASGTATMYTAPAAATSVTVTATAADSSAATALATITITAAGAITVRISSAPVSLQINGGAGITAIVNNDSTNAGVAWTVTCGSTGACGAFSAANTLSGIATDFTAPSAVPTGGTVTVTATSVAAPTAFASAIIDISGPNSTLADGSYVFSLSGASAVDANSSPSGSSPYSVAGVFTVSGGLITGGEQDFNNDQTIENDAINGVQSSISTTADGNLQITLTTCNGTDCTSTDSGVGVNGVETFNGSLACTCTAFITEFDTSATASGTLDSQTFIPAPSGGYAFTVAGMDLSGNPLAIGGILNVDGSGTISGAGSVFDINDAFVPAQNQTFAAAASTVTAPDASGRVTFNLVPSTASGVSPISLVGYIVDNTRIRLVEGDDAFGGVTGGTALAQGSNTGGFTSIAGNSYVFGISGVDGIGPLQAAGVLTAGGSVSGTVSGTINYNDLTGTGIQAPASVTGTYTLDATGRVTMTGVTNGAGAGDVSFNLQLYLSGSGTAVAATMDTTDVLAGLGYGQNGSFTASSFFGGYTLAAGGVDAVNEEPFFTIGPVTADGRTGFTGFADLNWLNPSTLTPDLPVTGTFVQSSGGIFTGTVKGLDVTTPSSPDDFTYYLIDSTNLIGIETDTNQLTLGYFDLQQ